MNPADYIYLFNPEEKKAGDDSVDEHGNAVKQETAQAYNKVGETANEAGDLKKAEAIMNYLGYSQEEFEIAGKDAYNYQGVGNPFINAQIKNGDAVLDIGSGLGVDSFIAKQLYTPNKGRVTGIDIS